MKKIIGILLLFLVLFSISCNKQDNTSLANKDLSFQVSDSKVNEAVSINNVSLENKESTPIIEDKDSNKTEGNYYGLIDYSGKEILPEKKHIIRIPVNGHITFFDKFTNLYGAMDMKGNIIVPQKSREPIVFLDNYFTDNKVLSEPKKSFENNIFNSDDGKTVESIYRSVRLPNGKHYYVTKRIPEGDLSRRGFIPIFYGIKDMEGKEILPTIYGEFYYINNFGILTSLKGKHGAFDFNFKTVFPFEFDFIDTRPGNGYAICRKGNKSYLYNKDGKMIMELKHFDGIIYDKYLGDKKYLIYKDGDASHVGLYENGKIVMPCKYDRSYVCYNGYCFSVGETKYCFDEKMNLLFSSKEYSMRSVEKNCVIIEKPIAWQIPNDPIDQINNYDQFFFASKHEEKDYKVVKKWLDKGFHPETKLYYGMASKKGKVILPCKYWYIERMGDSDFYKVGVPNKNVFGVVDSKGKIVVPCSYIDVNYIGDRFICEDEKGCHYIDLTGKYMKKLKNKFRFFRYLGDNFIIFKRGEKELKYYIMDKDENILSKGYNFIRFPYESDYMPSSVDGIYKMEFDYPKYLITTNVVK
ncbi:MAG: WG repeat-containing protein [Abditibacteriota bacterium]|nr:WG repeat-containing protein [Abditibacteriota bacterium]